MDMHLACLCGGMGLVDGRKLHKVIKTSLKSASLNQIQLISADPPKLLSANLS